MHAHVTELILLITLRKNVLVLGQLLSILTFLDFGGRSVAVCKSKKIKKLPYLLFDISLMPLF